MFESYVVAKIIQESTTIKSFYLKHATKNQLENYLPGQFVTVQVPLKDGKGILTRNYTLSDAPGKDYYRLTIKREDQGEVSRYFHDHLKAGDRLRLSKPLGNFHLKMESEKAVVLLSGGVGITPMLSMLHYILEHQWNRKVYFIHSSLNQSVQPFAQWLRQVESNHDQIHLTISHTLPEPNEQENIHFQHQGLLVREDLKKLIPEEEAEYYLCGPIAFMDSMFTHLTELGINDSHIFYEFFGEKKLWGEKNPDITSSNSNYEVFFKQTGLRMEWNNAFSNILDFAEANSLEPPSSCRMGTCLTCETALVKGTVQYNPEPFMDVPDDRILICCSRPTSDVEIDM